VQIPCCCCCCCCCCSLQPAHLVREGCPKRWLTRALSYILQIAAAAADPCRLPKCDQSCRSKGMVNSGSSGDCAACPDGQRPNSNGTACTDVVHSECQQWCAPATAFSRVVSAVERDVPLQQAMQQPLRHSITGQHGQRHQQ
jgi:hypothetical protein